MHLPNCFTPPGGPKLPQKSKAHHQYSRKADKSNVLIILVPHLDYSAWHLFVRDMKQWRRAGWDKLSNYTRQRGHKPQMKEPTQGKVCLYFSMFLNSYFTIIDQTLSFNFCFLFYAECFSHSDNALC